MEMIEGTYECVRGQSYVDFISSLGVDSIVCHRLLNSHWTLRMWRDGEIWGLSYMCREMPHLNTFHTFRPGQECRATHFVLGRDAMVLLRANGSKDGWSLSCESERIGRFTMETNHSEEGIHSTMSGKGRTMTEKWRRLSRTEGAYIFHRGENVDSYFTATGHRELLNHMHLFKIHIGKKGSTMFYSEHFGDYGHFSNTLELDVETPFFGPGCRSGTSQQSERAHSSMCLMSRTGVGRYMMVCKNRNGMIEEWNFRFNDWGLQLRCTEKTTGQTCTLHMKRFRDTSGTFRLISMSGFENFGSAMGISPESIREIMEDNSTRLIITDRGNGYIRHQLIRKKYPIDHCFKLNEQCSFYHPLLKEVVKSVGCVNHNSFCMMSKTSRGPLKSVMHFNDHFVTWNVTLPEHHVSTKMIFEWV